MWKLWLIISGLCFVIESFTVGFFIFWFGIGALIALVVSLFVGNFFIQSIIFIITSAIFLVLTKPLVKRFVKNNKTMPTNVYSIIGKEGIVLENIDNISYSGKVLVKGELWSAISDTNIEKDSKVKVVSIDGVKLKVEKVSETSNLI